MAIWLSWAGARFVHLRYLNPLPPNLGRLLSRFDRILVPEMNTGQLSSLLRDKLELSPIPFPKVTGQPFLISELTDKIASLQGTES